MRDSLIDMSSGNSFFSLEASSSLLLLGATITFACSSRVKFFHVKLGLMYSLYISRISLWLTTPGFVKFHIPVRFLFAISMDIGRSSSNIVIEFGMSVLLLKPDAGSERVAGIVLENAAGGVVNKYQPLLPTNIGERERAHHVSPDSLHLVGLTPVDVRTAGDPGGVKHMGRVNRRDIGLQRCPVLQPPRPVIILDPLSLAQFSQQPANPPRAAIDQELILLAFRPINRETHSCSNQMEKPFT
nr:Os03g0278250 [Ipomoea trifida]